MVDFIVENEVNILLETNDVFSFFLYLFIFTSMAFYFFFCSRFSAILKNLYAITMQFEFKCSND